jgi:hypothetical protein
MAEVSEGNNCRQETWSNDITAPVFVKQPTVGNRAFDGVTVIWQTNEPTNHTLTYGLDAGTVSHNVVAPAYTTHHTVTLTMLDASTAYRVQVKATDQAGNSKTSTQKYFTTLAVADTPVQFGAVSIAEYDSGFYEFFTLRASTLQTANVRYLDFHLDGHDLGSDYSPSPQYEVNLSPYALGYTRDTWYGQSHSVIIHGYNLTGTVNIWNTTVTAPPRPATPRDVDITEPHPNHTVWISGTTAMPGTILPVTVRAARLEWGCTWSGFSEPPEVPAGLDGVMCKDVDTNVTKMEVLLDGVSQGAFFPTAGVITHTFPVTLTGKGLGVHTLVAKATINTVTTQASKDFNIEVGAPSLNVFREVTRVGNALKVVLTLQNDGIGPALVDKLEDSLEGLQQVNGTRATYIISTTSSYFNGPERRHNRVLIDFTSSAGAEEVVIPPGASYSVDYWVVPILHEGSVTPYIGELPVKVTYKYDGQNVVRDFARPGSFVRNPDGSEVPLAQGLADAMRESDYLLVTNPTRLYNYYNTSDVNALLSEMAYLALVKNGTLGYLKTYDDGRILDDLLDKDTHRHWTAALHADFVKKNMGYVLIVGETEIVPSWYVGPEHFTTYVNIPDYVYQSDLPYANTGGNTARPEIALGRITGNSAADLAIPIHASVGVAESEPGYNWDRQRAVVISGRGAGVDSNFVPTVDIIAGVLDPEFDVTTIHAKDYTTFDQRLAALKASLVGGRDVIFFRDHGNYDQWSDVLYTGDVSGLDFAGHTPFAFAAACKAGNYEESDAWNITDELLRQGLGAYIASTQLSERTTNDIASKSFYRNWPLGQAVGVALNNAKIAVWDTDSSWESFDHEKLWAYEYNLYGDPKFGLSGGYSIAAAAAPAVAPPTAYFDVHIPAFEVAKVDGKDHVTIPGSGGQVWLEPGQYQIPYYTVAYDYPAGQRVQGITLTARSGLIITAGLEIPVMQPGTDCAGCDPLPPADVFSGTWAISPTLQYEWTVEQSPNRGSRLLVKIYPFYYNTETTGVLYYQDYGFDLMVSQTAVAVESLATDKAVYEPGEKAAISLRIENAGTATDVVVRTTIRYGDGVVDGLPLTILAAMTGTAALDLEWDTTGRAFGHYTLVVELLDSEGNVLDEATRDLGLGTTAGEVGSLAVSATVFDPGDSIAISMVLSNTGTVPLTGTVRIQIQTGDGLTATATFTQAYANLAPGGTVQVNKVWDTAGATGKAYRVLGNASYNGLMTDPEAVQVNARSRVFLPLVTRQ